MMLQMWFSMEGAVGNGSDVHLVTANNTLIFKARMNKDQKVEKLYDLLAKRGIEHSCLTYKGNQLKIYVDYAKIMRFKKTLLDFEYLPLLARRVEKTFDDCNARWPQVSLSIMSSFSS
ncbi:hypothetical protein Y032_0010g1206 [Ancylostoma ceylanicum]|nr:hypothetical protein Y032_0010g1206 [Ancylostoma ceylanicum]